jgi:hypothetical protein
MAFSMILADRKCGVKEGLFLPERYWNGYFKAVPPTE